MGKVFIVVVELKMEEGMSLVKNTLSTFGLWCQIVKNSYAIKLHDTLSVNAVDIRDSLTNAVGEDIILFVMEASNDAAWRVFENNSNWLKDNLRNE